MTALNDQRSQCRIQSRTYSTACQRETGRDGHRRHIVGRKDLAGRPLVPVLEFYLEDYHVVYEMFRC